MTTKENEFQPSYIIYSRAYLSFSELKKKGLEFIKDLKEQKKFYLN